MKQKPKELKYGEPCPECGLSWAHGSVKCSYPYPREPRDYGSTGDKPKKLDWEKDWNKLTVKSYNLKTEKYEDEPIIFVNDKSWKKVKNFIQSLLTQQRTELLEEILDGNFCDLDGTYDYDGIAESVIDLHKKL